MGIAVPTGLLKILMRNLPCQTQKYHGMVWFIIKWTPCSFETVTDSTCRQMLVDYAWSQFQDKRLYFQDDRALPHYALLVGE